MNKEKNKIEKFFQKYPNRQQKYYEKIQLYRSLHQRIENINKCPLLTLNLCAIQIQRFTRGFLTRKQVRDNNEDSLWDLNQDWRSKTMGRKTDQNKIINTLHFQYSIVIIQQFVRNIISRKQEVSKNKVQGKLKAVTKIQNAWRGQCYRKIQNQLKNLVAFNSQGDPQLLLKSINPIESQLLDAASNAQVKFRLGGINFPPTIYQKIFVKGAVQDINSYAPRDQTKENKSKTQITNNIGLDTKEGQFAMTKLKNDRSDWYKRDDQCGWRPIVSNVTFKTANNQIIKNEAKYHSWNPKVRRELNAKEKRAKKLKWLRKLYKDAKVEALKEMTDQGQLVQLDGEQDLERDVQENLPNELVELPDNEFNDEVTQLLEWTDNLDQDRQLDDWNHVASSSTQMQIMSTLKDKKMALNNMPFILELKEEDDL